MTYRVIIGRCHDNPLTGRAQYRVSAAWKAEYYDIPIVSYIDYWQDIIMSVTDYKQVGSYINPTRALKATLERKNG